MFIYISLLKAHPLATRPFTPYRESYVETRTFEYNSTFLRNLQMEETTEPQLTESEGH